MSISLLVCFAAAISAPPFECIEVDTTVNFNLEAMEVTLGPEEWGQYYGVESCVYHITPKRIDCVVSDKLFNNSFENTRP